MQRTWTDKKEGKYYIINEYSIYSARFKDRFDYTEINTSHCCFTSGNGWVPSCRITCLQKTIINSGVKATWRH